MPRDQSRPEGWGWAGSVADFALISADDFVHALSAHHHRLRGEGPSGLQLRAWNEEYEALTHAFAVCNRSLDTSGWSVIFEYELPMEGGRRPDVVVLAGSTVVVLEFKSTIRFIQAHADQVEAYARDLTDYHEESRGHRVVPVLVMRNVPPIHGRRRGTAITDEAGIDQQLSRSAELGRIDLNAWLRSPYAPLPTLIAAARRIFRHERLPHVRRAISHGIPETVARVSELVDRAEHESRRALILVTGVPGSGKTLVGLRSVYERSSFEGDATFLSGNGPLVQVLQDALRSRVFVRDLHAYIKMHGIQGRVPKQHLIVFDEAQRAWDRQQMMRKHGVDSSEPDLLVRAGESVPRWSVLVGLVGEGQEIHTGEEAGLGQWKDAIVGGQQNWEVHCAPAIRDHFDGLDVHADSRLKLEVSIRSHRAERLHEWVAHLLSGDVPSAQPKAREVLTDGTYDLYLTRNLDAAKVYVRTRYEDQPDSRYGLVTSSHAWRFFAKYGIRSGFLDIRALKVARWFNADADDPVSGCSFNMPVTEFQCQGLELDMPIVCWGTDYMWRGSSWNRTAIRRQPPLANPEQIVENAYRVLLTRGRDGVVVFLPPDTELDGTAEVLLAAGLRHLPMAEEIVAGDPIVGASGF